MSTCTRCVANVSLVCNRLGGSVVKVSSSVVREARGTRFESKKSDSSGFNIGTLAGRG